MSSFCRGCYYFDASELTEIGYCNKHCIKLHEKTIKDCISYVEVKPKEDVIDKLIESFSKK